MKNLWIKIFKSINFLEFSIVLILTIITVALRFFPHPPNFSPIFAFALFAGFYFSKKIALILPIMVMIISDFFIGYYEIILMIFVYVSFLIFVFLGFWLKKNKKWFNILGTSILGALLFYLITNFAVWIFTPWYMKTFSGLIHCYIMALPFFKNTLLGSLFYSSLFFIAYDFAIILAKKTFKREAYN